MISVPYDDSGDWRKNTLRKAGVWLSWLRENHGPAWFVDADTRMIRYPNPPNSDFGAVPTGEKENPIFCSPFWFGMGAEEFLSDWTKRSEQDTNPKRHADHGYLTEAVHALNPSYTSLPPEYCHYDKVRSDTVMFVRISRSASKAAFYRARSR